MIFYHNSEVEGFSKQLRMQQIPIWMSLLHSLQYLMGCFHINCCHSIVFLKVHQFLLALQELNMLIFQLDEIGKQFLEEKPVRPEGIFQLLLHHSREDPILHLLNPFDFIHIAQTHSQAAFIFVFTFVPFQEGFDCTVNERYRGRFYALAIIGQNDDGLRCRFAIPHWFGEVFRELPGWVGQKVIGIDHVVMVPEIVPSALSVAAGADAGEGIDLLVEHRQQVETALEDESFAKFDLRIVIWIHSLFNI